MTGNLQVILPRGDTGVYVDRGALLHHRWLSDHDYSELQWALVRDVVKLIKPIELLRGVKWTLTIKCAQQWYFPSIKLS